MDLNKATEFDKSSLRDGGTIKETIGKKIEDLFNRLMEINRNNRGNMPLKDTEEGNSLIKLSKIFNGIIDDLYPDNKYKKDELKAKFGHRVANLEEGMDDSPQNIRMAAIEILKEDDKVRVENTIRRVLNKLVEGNVTSQDKLFNEVRAIVEEIKRISLPYDEKVWLMKKLSVGLADNIEERDAIISKLLGGDVKAGEQRQPDLKELFDNRVSELSEKFRKAGYGPARARIEAEAHTQKQLHVIDNIKDCLVGILNEAVRYRVDKVFRDKLGKSYGPYSIPDLDIAINVVDNVIDELQKELRNQGKYEEAKELDAFRVRAFKVIKEKFLVIADQYPGQIGIVQKLKNGKHHVSKVMSIDKDYVYIVQDNDNSNISGDKILISELSEEIIIIAPLFLKDGKILKEEEELNPEERKNIKEVGDISSDANNVGGSTGTVSSNTNEPGNPGVPGNPGTENGPSGPTAGGGNRGAGFGGYRGFGGR